MLHHNWPWITFLTQTQSYLLNCNSGLRKILQLTVFLATTLPSVLEGFDPIGKKLAAGGAVAVVFFEIGMGGDAVVNVIEKPLGGKQSAAAFAAL